MRAHGLLPSQWRGAVRRCDRPSPRSCDRLWKSFLAAAPGRVADSAGPAAPSSPQPSPGDTEPPGSSSVGDDAPDEDDEPWPVVIRIGAHELSPEVAFSPEGGASLRDYLRLPPVHYTLLELPLGARLSRDDGCVGTDAEADVAASRFLLRAPPLRVLSLLLVPTVRVAAAVGPDAVVLRVVSATLEGSLAAALAGRFRLTGATTFAASGCGRRVASRTSLLLRVRPPPPFSSLPAAALRRVGEAAVGAMSAALQRVFVAALARDYARWAEAAGGGGGGGGGAGRGAGLVGAAGGGGREEEHQEDEASGGEDERGEGGGAERAGSGGRPV